MSCLTKISVGGDGLKGFRGDVDLHGCDLFVGPNGSGKTTRLLAVTAALRGLAQSPTGQDAGKVWIGPDRPEARVVLTYAAGTMSRDLSKVGGKDAARSDLDAERLAGAHVARWDLADFASGSEKDRESLIRRVCAGSGDMAPWAVSRVRAQLSKGLAEGATLPTLHPVNDLLKVVPATSWVSAGKWVEDALTWSRDAFTKANAEAAIAEKGEAAKRQDLDGALTPTGTLADARAKVERLDSELQTARAALTAGDADRKAAAAHAAEGDRLSRAYGQLEQEHQRLTAIRVVIPELGDLDGRAAALTAARDACAAKVTAAEEALQKATKHRAEMDARVKAARRTLAGAESTEATLRSLEEAATGGCRHCQGADPLGLSDRIGAAALAARTALEAATLAEEDLDDAESLRVLAVRRLTVAQEALRAAEETTRRDSAAATAERATFERATRDAARAAEDVARVTAALERARVDLEEWQARAAPVVAVVGQDVSEAIAALEASHKQAQKDVEAFIRHTTVQRLHQEAVALREATRARLEAVKALGNALKDVQAELARRAFGPLVTEADKLLVESGEPWRVTFRTASDFGATGPKGYVHFAALSDAERAIVGVAIAYGLIRLSGAPWRALLLDGLEKVDSERLPRLLAALAKMVKAGELDNVIGAVAAANIGEDVAYDAPSGVTVHWLGGAVGAPEES